MGDYIAGGFLQDISTGSPRTRISPGTTSAGSSVTLREVQRQTTHPLDGDFHMIYYRTDVFKDAGLTVPETWDDYVPTPSAERQRHERRRHARLRLVQSPRSGTPAYWFITSVAGGYLQSKGTGQGAFFDPKDMKPLVNNEAFGKALDIYAETTKYGPPNEINLDVGDTRGCSPRPLRAVHGLGRHRSVAVDRLRRRSRQGRRGGSAGLEGSPEPRHWQARGVHGDLCRTPPTASTTPRRSSAAGAAASTPTRGQDQGAAFAFLSYVSAPAQSNVDVTIGKTGFNPYRTSQFKDSARGEVA